MSDIRKKLVLEAELQQGQNLSNQLKSLRDQIKNAVKIDDKSLDDLRSIGSIIGSSIKEEIKKAIQSAHIDSKSINDKKTLTGVSGEFGKTLQDSTKATLQLTKLLRDITKTETKRGESTGLTKTTILKSEGGTTTVTKETTTTDRAAARHAVPQTRFGNESYAELGKKGLAFAGASAGGLLSLIKIAVKEQELKNQQFMYYSQGKILEGTLRQNAYEQPNIGKAGGIAAGGITALLGSAALLSPLLATPLAPLAYVGMAGATALGAGAGKQMGADLWADFNVERSRKAIEAEQQARAVREARLKTMEGGNRFTRGLLNFRQDIGAKYSYSPAETLQSLIATKGILGNEEASTVLGALQRESRMSGTDIMTQAVNLETIRGATGKGIKTGAASMAQQRMLEMAFARGLDLSKTSEFLKVNTQFIQTNLGTGKLNIESLANELVAASAGFAGKGGEQSATTLRQAQTLMQKQAESATATTGIAGLGNWLAAAEFTQTEVGSQFDILDVLRLGKGQGLETLAKTQGLTVQDLINRFGRTKINRADKQLKMKGIENVFGGSLGLSRESYGRYFIGQETGWDTGQIMGAQEAMDAQKRALDTPISEAKRSEREKLGAEIFETPEAKYSAAEFTRDSIIIKQGLGLFDEATQDVTKNIRNLAVEFGDAYMHLVKMRKIAEASEENKYSLFNNTGGVQYVPKTMRNK